MSSNPEFNINSPEEDLRRLLVKGGEQDHLAQLRQAGVSGILGGMLGPVGKLFGVEEGIRALHNVGKAAEDHFGVDKQLDPSVNNDLFDVSKVTQDDQDAHSAGYALGDGTLGDDTRTEMERNKVPPQVWAPYMQQISNMMGNAMDGRAFMDVATACLVRRRNLYKDPNAWVQSAVETMNQLNAAAQSVGGQDIYHIADRALQGDQSWLNTLMMMQLGFIMHGDNGQQINTAIQAIERVLDPNTPMNAQMSELALERDKMQTSQFQFGLGVAGLKKNYTETYYKNMSVYFRSLTDQLGPFSKNPMVQKLIGTMYGVATVFSKAQAVLGATGFYNGTAGESSNIAPHTTSSRINPARTAQSGGTKPSLLVNSPTSGGAGADTSYQPSYVPTSQMGAQYPGSQPAGFGAEQSEEERNRGIAPNGYTGVATPGQAQFRYLIRQMTGQYGVVTMSDKSVETAQSYLASIQSSMTQSQNIDNLGLSTRGLMTEEQISSVVGTLEDYVNQANQWVTWVQNATEQIDQLNSDASNSAGSGFTAEMAYQIISDARAKVAKDRSQLKMILAAAQDIEKAWPYELQLIDLNADIDGAKADLERIQKLNETMKRPTNIGLFGTSMTPKIDPQTGMTTGVETKQAPGTLLVALYQQYIDIVQQAIVAYSAGAQHAQGQGASQYATMFATSVKQLTAKMKKMQSERAILQYSQLDGKVPAGWSNALPTKGASSTRFLRLSDAQPENEEFSYWGDLLGEKYEATYEEAGGDLHSKTTEQALESKRKKFKRTKHV